MVMCNLDSEKNDECIQCCMGNQWGIKEHIGNSGNVMVHIENAGEIYILSESH